MDIEIGTAQFVDANTISVNGKNHSASKIILATGSKARKLKVEGREKVTHIFDNESLFWEMEELPDRLLVIGGGPISCEMAQALQRLGSQVTIVNRGAQILAKERPAFRDILAERLKEEGIQILNESEIKAFTGANSAILSSPNGEEAIEFDAIIEAIGREVRIEELDLAKAGVQVERGKMLTDPYYRTTNPRVYAIGDAYGAEQFSHGAEMHNFDLYNNLLSPFKKKHRLDSFSWVTFTEPSIASFGLDEEKLKREAKNFDVIIQDFAEDDRAVVDEYRYGRLVLFVSKSSIPFRKQKILGGSMIAPQAGELVQELILAMKAGTPISEITRKIYPYPVASRINQKAIRSYSQKGLLTPFVKKMIRWAYRHAPW